MKKFDKNIGVNFISFLLYGITGILINITIIKLYNVSVLGRFNLLLTILVIISHFSVGGVHFSVLKYNSHFQDKVSSASSVVSSGLVLTFAESLIVVFILYNIAPFIEKLFHSEGLGFLAILPGLIFFSLNKVLLMSLNGLNFMGAYAFFNGTRYLMLLFFVFVYRFLSFDSLYIGSVISMSEFTFFLINILFFNLKVTKLSFPDPYWIKKHFYFGIKGLWGGALYDSNMHIDILMIGYFLSDKAVGIYSFASLIGFGFAQLNLVLKNTCDPIFGKAIFEKKLDIIRETIKKVRRKYFPFIVAVGLILIFLYNPVFKAIMGKDANIIEKSKSVITIIVIFVIISSYFWPFIGLLNQKGKPEFFSIVIMISVVLNVLLNSILIPVLGINGAALSTGFIFVFQSAVLYVLGKKVVFLQSWH